MNTSNITTESHFKLTINQTDLFLELCYFVCVRLKILSGFFKDLFLLNYVLESLTNGRMLTHTQRERGRLVNEYLIVPLYTNQPCLPFVWWPQSESTGSLPTSQRERRDGYCPPHKPISSGAVRLVLCVCVVVVPINQFLQTTNENSYNHSLLCLRRLANVFLA